MIVYLSGPIKDNPDYLDDFADAQRLMLSQGHTTVNPCNLDHKPDATYEDFMREDVKAELNCEAIFMLQGWQQSRGARLEHDVAIACGLTLMYQ